MYRKKVNPEPGTHSLTLQSVDFKRSLCGFSHQLLSFLHAEVRVKGARAKMKLAQKVEARAKMKLAQKVEARVKMKLAQEAVMRDPRLFQLCLDTLKWWRT